jgi:hypothetical protein
LAMKLQLDRVAMHIDIFANLFLAFLLSEQVKKGNFLFFFFLFVAFTNYYVFFNKLGVETSKHTIQYVLVALLLFYEIFNKYVDGVLNRIFSKLKKTAAIAKIQSGYFVIISKPVLLTFLLILIIIPLTPSIRNQVKSVMGVSSEGHSSASTPYESLHIDIANFLNNETANKRITVLAPFHEIDFEYFVKHKVLFNAFTPINYFKDVTKEGQQFQMILENDLNSSLQELFFVSGKYDRSSFNSVWKKNWQKIDEITLTKWNTEYGLTHVVRENQFPLVLKILYKNNHYTVYEI